MGFPFPFFATWYVDIPFESIRTFVFLATRLRDNSASFAKYPRCEGKRDGERGKIAFARPENESV